MNNQKQLIFIIAFILMSILVCFLIMRPHQKRVVASETLGSTAEFLKSHLVSWNETENGLLFKVSESTGEVNICDKWQSLDIVFRAEGIAYSGEVDRVVQTATCEEGKFQQTWTPNLTQATGDHIQKTGYFMEEPPKWVMEQIVLEGKAGTQVLSTQEIYQQYGSIPTLTPQ